MSALWPSAVEYKCIECKFESAQTVVSISSLAKYYYCILNYQCGKSNEKRWIWEWRTCLQSILWPYWGWFCIDFTTLITSFISWKSECWKSAGAPHIVTLGSVGTLQLLGRSVPWTVTAWTGGQSPPYRASPTKLFPKDDSKVLYNAAYLQTTSNGLYIYINMLWPVPAWH